MKKTGFPLNFFVLYLVVYTVQATYNTYVNLYLYDRGFTKTQIGLAVSIATAALLLIQPLWGLAGDRAKTKNTVLRLLMAGSAVAILFYPRAQGFLGLLGVTALFSALYNPVIPLQDTLTLEALEGTGWDFGRVRMGGTIGFACSVAVVGRLLHNDYGGIFPIVSVALLLSLALTFTLPAVPGHRREGQRAPVRAIFRDRRMLCLIFYNIVYALASSLYYNFYPIHFQSIGGTSAQIGIMTFAASIAELPFLLFANRLIRRFGVQRLILFSGVVTSIRWLLLFRLTNPLAIIFTNTLHGMGFIIISYCLTVTINTSVPKELRATGQTTMALLATIFSRLLFGYLGGLAADLVGVANLMLFSCVVTLLGTAVFTIWFHAVDKPADAPA